MSNWKIRAEFYIKANNKDEAWSMATLDLPKDSQIIEIERERESMNTQAKLPEITVDEMVREGYQAVLEEKEETAWVKTIKITDKAGVSTTYWLYWNMGDGYRLEIVNGIGLPDLAMRPEFEYVLDCLTEERP